MTLEEEIKMLKEKVELLEKIKELQEALSRIPTISYVPYIPAPWQPYVWPQITWGTGSIGITPKDAVVIW